MRLFAALATRPDSQAERPDAVEPARLVVFDEGHQWLLERRRSLDTSDPALRELLKRVRVRGETMRLGFLWLSRGKGTLVPLVSVPLRLDDRDLRRDRLVVDGEPEWWDDGLIDSFRDRWATDLASARYLTDVPGLTTLKSVELQRVDLLRGMRDDLATRPELRRIRLDPFRSQVEPQSARPALIVGAALYADAEPVHRITNAGVFDAWAERDIGSTAFAHLYEPPPARDPWPAGVLLSPNLLDRSQSTALEAARSGESTTVITGPPGTGKSQTVVAIVADAVARGERVLVAAPSGAAVAALADLMSRQPGPRPVVFGGGRNERHDLADDLAFERRHDVSDDELRRAIDERDDLVELRSRLRDRIERALLAEQQAAGVAPAADLLARERAPGLFDPDADHEAVAQLVASAGANRSAW